VTFLDWGNQPPLYRALGCRHGEVGFKIANGQHRRGDIKPSGRSLCGGYFTHIGGANRAYAARLGRDDGLADAWNPNPNYRSSPSRRRVSSLYRGEFTNVNGVGRQTLARVDAKPARSIHGRRSSIIPKKSATSIPREVFMLGVVSMARALKHVEPSGAIYAASRR
jgi:hypothetical protein